jgi:photosystem II stability/assembly factor-like uncharacterized protein
VPAFFSQQRLRLMVHVLTQRLTGFASMALAVLLLGPWLASGASASQGGPDGSLDAVYAESLPLASQSLLLDVTRLGDGRLVAVGERGHVVFSDDDGASWAQAEHVPTRSTLTAVTTHAGRLWAVGHDTVILTSGDRGLTWTTQYFDPERQQAAMDVRFFSPTDGMVIGAYGLFMLTSDGGLNWEDSAVGEEEWHLNSLLDLGDGQLIIAGEAGLSYVSNDGGETWEVVDMPYPGSMFGIAASGECVVVFGLRGNVQESCDGGISWQELETPTQQSLSAGASFNGELLLAGNGGVVLRRAEDGSFSAYTHSSGVDFAAVIHLDDGSWLLVGESGSHRFPETAGSAEGGS